jgi:hypothetical protein
VRGLAWWCDEETAAGLGAGAMAEEGAGEPVYYTAVADYDPEGQEVRGLGAILDGAAAPALAVPALAVPAGR